MEVSSLFPSGTTDSSLHPHVQPPPLPERHKPVVAKNSGNNHSINNASSLSPDLLQIRPSSINRLTPSTDNNNNTSSSSESLASLFTTTTNSSSNSSMGKPPVHPPKGTTLDHTPTPPLSSSSSTTTKETNNNSSTVLIQQLKQEITVLTNKVDQQTNDIKALQTDLSVAKVDIEKRDAAISRGRNALQKLQENVVDIRAQLNQSEKTITESNEKVIQTEYLLSKSQEEITGLRNQLSNLSSVPTPKAEVHKYEEEIIALRKQMETYDTKYTKLQDDFNQLQTLSQQEKEKSTNDFNALRESARGKISQFRNELAAVQSTNSSLTTQLTALQEEKEALQKQISTLSTLPVSAPSVVTVPSSIESTETTVVTDENSSKRKDSITGHGSGGLLSRATNFFHHTGNTNGSQQQNKTHETHVTSTSTVFSSTSTATVLPSLVNVVAVPGQSSSTVDTTTSTINNSLSLPPRSGSTQSTRSRSSSNSMIITASLPGGLTAIGIPTSHMEALQNNGTVTPKTIAIIEERLAAERLEMKLRLRESNQKVEEAEEKLHQVQNILTIEKEKVILYNSRIDDLQNQRDTLHDRLNQLQNENDNLVHQLQRIAVSHQQTPRPTPIVTTHPLLPSTVSVTSPEKSIVRGENDELPFDYAAGSINSLEKLIQEEEIEEKRWQEEQEQFVQQQQKEQEIQYYREQIQTLQMKLMDVEKSASQRRQVARKLLSDLQQVMRDYETSKESLEKMKQELRTVHESNNSKDAEVATLMTRLREAETVAMQQAAAIVAREELNAQNYSVLETRLQASEGQVKDLEVIVTNARKDHHDQVHTLRNEIDTLKSTSHQQYVLLEENLATVTLERNENRIQVENLEQRLQTCLTELQQAKILANRAETSGIAAEEQMKQYETSLQAMKEQNQSNETKINELENAVQSTEQRAIRAEKAYETVVAQQQQIETVNLTLQTQLREMEETQIILRNEVKKSTEQRQDSASEVQRLQSLRTEREEEFVRLQNDYQQLQDTLRTMQQETMITLTDKAALQVNYAELEGKYQQLEDNYKQLTTKLSSRIDETPEPTATPTPDDTVITSLEAQISVLMENNNNLETRILRLKESGQARIDQLKQSLAEEKELNASLQVKVNEAHQQAVQYSENTIQDLRKTVQQLQVTVSQSNDTERTLQNEVEIQKKEVERIKGLANSKLMAAKEVKENAEMVANEAKQQAEQYKQELDHLRHQLTTTAENKVNAESTIAHLQAENRTLLDKLHHHETIPNARIRELEKELEDAKQAIITISDAAQESANAAEAAARTAAVKSAEEAQDRILLGQLKIELQAAQTKIQALEAERQGLMQQYENRAQGNENGLKDTIAKYETDLQRMKNERDNLIIQHENQLNELKETNQVITHKQKDQIRTLIQNNVEAVQKLENQLRTLENEKQEAHSRFLQVQHELSVTQQIVRDNGNTSANSLSAYQSLQQQYTVLQDQLNSTENELRIAQTTATEMSMKLIAAQEEQAQSIDTVSAEKVESLENRYQQESLELTNQLSLVHTELGKARFTIKELEEQVHDKVNKYNELVGSMDTQIVTVMKKLNHDWLQFEESTHEQLRSLNERFRYLQEDCASLMETIAQKETDITDLQLHLQKKEEEFNSYVNKLTTQGLQRARHHKDEKRTLEEHIQHLQAELEYYSSQMQKLNEQNEVYINEYEIVEQRCNELVDQLQDAMDTKVELYRTNESLTKEITKLKDEVKTAQTNTTSSVVAEEQAQQILSLQAQIDQNHAFVINAETTMDNVQRYVEHLHTTALTVQKDFGLLTDPPVPSGDKLRDIQQILHAVYHHCTELEDTLGQRTETVTTLSVEKDNLHQELGTVQTSYHNALESIHHIREEMNKAIALRDKEVIVLQQTIETVTDEKHGAQRVMHLTLDKLRHANKVIEEHKLQEKQLYEQLEARTKEHDEVTNNYAILYEAYQDVVSMNKHLDEKEERHSARDHQMNEAYQEAHQALQEARTIIENNERQMKQLMIDNEALQNQFEDERKELLDQRNLAMSTLNILRTDNESLQNYTEQTMTKVTEEKKVLLDLEEELQRTKTLAQRTEEDLRSQLANLRIEMDAYRIRTVKDTSQEGDIEYEQLIQDYGKLKDEHTALLNEFTEVMSQVGTAIKQVESLREEASAASAVSTMLEKKLANNQQLLTDTQTTLDRVRHERDKLRQENNDLQEKVTELVTDSSRTMNSESSDILPSTNIPSSSLSKEDDDLLRQLLVESRNVSHESSIRASNLQEQCNTLLRQVDALIAALDDHDPVNARNGLLSTLLGHQRDATMARNENKELKERLENAIEESVQLKLEMEQWKRSTAIPTIPSSPLANENLQAALTAAREASALAMEDVASLSAKLSEAATRLDTTEQKLVTVETERANTQQRVKELTNEITLLKKQLTIQAQDFAQASKSAIESERAKHHQTIEELNKGNEIIINQLKSTINHLEKTIDKLETNITDLVQKGKVSEARRIVLENLLEETNNELKEAEQHAIDNEKKIEALLKVSSAVDVATSPRKESNVSDGTEKLSPVPTVASSSSTIQLLTEPSTIDQTILETEIARATAAEAARVSAEVALKNMKNDNDLLRRELAATSVQLAETSASLASADELITELRTKLANKEDNYDTLRNQYAVLSNQYRSLQEEHNEVSTTLQTNMQDIVILTSKLEEFEKLSNDSRTENEVLRRSTVQLQTQVNELTESNTFLSDKLQQDHTELLNALTQLELHEEHEAEGDRQLQAAFETMQTLQGKLTNTFNEMNMLQEHRNASIQLAARLSNRISEFELLNKKIVSLLQPVLTTLNNNSSAATVNNEDTVRTVIALLHSLLSQTCDDEGGLSPRTLIPHNVNAHSPLHRGSSNYTSWVTVNSPGEPVMDAASFEPMMRMNALERTLRLLHAQLEAYYTAELASASNPTPVVKENEYALASLQLEISLVHPLLSELLNDLGGKVTGVSVTVPNVKVPSFRSSNTLAYPTTVDDDNSRTTIEKYEAEIQAWKDGTATKTPHEAAGKLAALAAALNELSQELDNKSRVTAQALSDAEFMQQTNENLTKEVETLRASHQALATQVPLLRKEFIRLENQVKEAENEARIARESMIESRSLAAKHEAGAAAAALRARELETALEDVSSMAKNAQTDSIAARAIIDQLQSELNRYKDSNNTLDTISSTSTIASVPIDSVSNLTAYQHAASISSPSLTALAQSEPVLTATPAARAIIGQLQAQLKDALAQRDAIRNEMQALVNAAVGAALFTSPTNGSSFPIDPSNVPAAVNTTNHTNPVSLSTSPTVQKLFSSPVAKTNGSFGSNLSSVPPATAQVIVSGIGTTAPVLTMLPVSSMSSTDNEAIIGVTGDNNDNQWIKSTEPAVEETVRSLQSRVHQLEGALQEAIIREASAYKQSSSVSTTNNNGNKSSTLKSSNRTTVPSSGGTVYNRKNTNTTNEPTVTSRPKVTIPGNNSGANTNNTTPNGSLSTTTVPLTAMPDARILLTKGLTGRVRRG